MHGLSSEFFQLILHVIQIGLLLLSRRVDVLSQSAQLFDLLDLTLHDVEHTVQVFKVRSDLRLLKYKWQLSQGANWRQAKQSFLEIDEEVFSWA